MEISPTVHTENQNNYILALVDSGLSLIPITEGEKKPHKILGPKHDLLTRRATHEEVASWIATGVKSWGVAGGKVSGNLVTLDFDEKHYPGLYDLWYAKLSDDQKKIADACYKNNTRNNGKHLRYRTETAQPTAKLARRLKWSEKIKRKEIVTTAEVRGEGAYALIPPSAGYTSMQGDLKYPPLVTDEMHKEFIDILRTFNEVIDEPPTEYEWKPTDKPRSDRPGDRLNALATWNEVLGPHGWVEETKNYWRRPGKDKGEGISATTNYDNRPMFYVFSTSAAPFNENKGYSKFHAFALLNHGGDFKAAARAAVKIYPQAQDGVESAKHPTSEEAMERCQILLNEIPKNTPKESVLKALTPLLGVLAAEAGLAEAEIYIRNKIKAELKINVNDVNSILKHFKEMRVPIRAKMEAEQKRAEQLETEPPLTEGEKQTAEHILKSPTLLYDILMMVKKLGVVGEERNILLHYIILTSRKLKQPLSATVKGDSASGKSYTLLTTIKMFPKSAYIDLTDATPQSFYYCPEDHFKHKIIVIFEKHGGERADYAIRTLQSEGKLKIQVTVKNPETGQFEAQTIEKDGPTGFVTTTTESFIHSENDTRNISMFPDQSSEQTSRVYESVDSRYLGFKPISDDELKPWHHAQLILEQLPVHIPFVRSFRKYFPKHIIRTRRDYGHFLAIIETVAFLYQKQRARIDSHGQNYIQATLADAYMAKVIVENSLSKSIYELPEKSVEVIEMARALVGELREKLSNEEKGGDITFTITGLAKKLEWDRDTVAKWMKPACKKGYLTIVEENKGAKGATYKVEDKELPGDTFLPTVEQLMADNPKERTDGIYDPLTGEIKTILLNSDIPSTDAPIELEGGKNQGASISDASFYGGSNSIGASVQNNSDLLLEIDAVNGTLMLEATNDRNSETESGVTHDLWTP